MIKILKYGIDTDKDVFTRFTPQYGVEDVVAEIIDNVRNNGDKALFEYNEKYDGAVLSELKVSSEEIEEAIQKRDAFGGKVTVITIGGEDAEKQLRTALAMGADEAVLINTEDDLDELDQYSSAYILAEYLKDKEADLILAGFSGDVVCEDVEAYFNDFFSREV